MPDPTDHAAQPFGNSEQLAALDAAIFACWDLQRERKPLPGEPPLVLDGWYVAGPHWYTIDPVESCDRSELTPTERAAACWHIDRWARWAGWGYNTTLSTDERDSLVWAYTANDCTPLDLATAALACLRGMIQPGTPS